MKTKYVRKKLKIQDIAGLFKNPDNSQLVLTPNQMALFKLIVTQTFKRNIILAPTQWGKSMTIGIGILASVLLYPDKWAIIAPSEKKTQIIMNYIIDHIGDKEMFREQLDIDTSYDRLRRERSKRRLKLKNGGEIFCLTADSKNRKKIGESLLGFGANKIALDESSLIDDDVYAMIKRMLGGSHHTFLLEIGNPFKRNHFQKTWESPVYNKLFIDYKMALAEGRFTDDGLPMSQRDIDAGKTSEFIEEMRGLEFFSVLYECKFPTEDDIDNEGWSVLITTAMLDGKIDKPISPKGVKRLGVDVSRGGRCFNTYVIRQDNFMYLKSKDQKDNLIDIADKVIEICTEEKIDFNNVFIDDNMVGSGVTDSLKKRNLPIIGVKSQNVSPEQKYYNVKSMLHWRMREWCKGDISIQSNDDIDELFNLFYKINDKGKIVIMPKEKMKRKGIDSPDFSDGAALTFFRKDTYYENYEYLNRQPDQVTSVDSITGYPTDF